MPIEQVGRADETHRQKPDGLQLLQTNPTGCAAASWPGFFTRPLYRAQIRHLRVPESPCQHEVAVLKCRRSRPAVALRYRYLLNVWGSLGMGSAASL